MSIPFSSLPDGLEKTLGTVGLEIRERLQGQGLRYHSGIPSADRLPDEDEQVWVAPMRLEHRRELDTFQSESYASRWAIHFIVLDRHPEKYQSDYGPLFRHVGRTVEALNNTNANKGLDGAIDWGETENIEFFEAEPAAGGDHGVLGLKVEVLAYHPLWPVRTT